MWKWKWSGFRSGLIKEIGWWNIKEMEWWNKKIERRLLCFVDSITKIIQGTYRRTGQRRVDLGGCGTYTSLRRVQRSLTLFHRGTGHDLKEICCYVSWITSNLNLKTFTLQIGSVPE